MTKFLKLNTLFVVAGLDPATHGAAPDVSAGDWLFHGLFR
jgi:hypothetical protein